MHDKKISGPEDSFDEEAAIEAAQERSAVPHLRDVLKREHEEVLKGRPRNIALDKWGAEIEAEIMADIEKQKRPE
ncbi:MAG: hypothetical protein WBQ43_05115 [Terriglobales bacterium]